MAEQTYKTAPDHELTRFPPGVPYIVGNEGCERFSFYGMKAILWVYIVFLLQQHGLKEAAAGAHATEVVHLFVTGVYFFPLIGSLMADRLLGKYHTILWLSLVYCAGHVVLSLTEGSVGGMYAGLALIALGSGGIKPCVSAHVGDQFGAGNWHLLKWVYQAFYFIINFGSTFATLLIPLFKEWWGWSVAFAIPGILMFIATAVFWMGRHTFVHVPARPGGTLGLLDTLSGTFLALALGALLFFPWEQPALPLGVAAGSLVLGLFVFKLRQDRQQDDGFLAITFYAVGALLRGEGPRPADAPGSSLHHLAQSRFWGPAVRKFGLEATEGPVAVLKIISVFFLVSMFWALFDQHASTWIQQASMMDREFSLPVVGTFEVLPEQISSLNPVLVMILIPILGFGVYPLFERKLSVSPTPLRRMSVGMFIASLAFVSVALIQSRIQAGAQMHVAWQLLPYTLMTLSEVLVSITGLEFAYTQAPPRMKSVIMGFWLLTVAFGNKLVALLAGFKSLDLVSFFWVFAALMAGAAILFTARAAFYTVKDYTQ